MIAVIMIDALAKEYINHMSFLKKLASSNIFIETYLPLAGFEHRHYLLWGRYPDEIDKYTMYRKTKKSPFRMLVPFLPLLKKIENYPELNSKIKKYISKTVSFLNGYKINLNNIPYEFAPYFDMSGDRKPIEKLKIEEYDSIFDIFKKNKISYKYLWYPYTKGTDTDKKRIQEFKSTIKEKKHDVVFLHLSNLDKYGHEYGLSKKTFFQVKKMDNVLEDILSKKEVEKFILFGDHGMVETKSSLDVMKKLSKLKKENKLNDLVWFVDSTTLRLWYKKSQTKKKVGRFLKKLSSFGYLMDKKMRKKYHLEFNHDLFGVDIFVLKKKYVFVPSFFSNTKVKGMHGYLPEDNPSFLICSGKNKKISTASEIDVLPTLLDLLSLYSDATDLPGQSLLKR